MRESQKRNTKQRIIEIISDGNNLNRDWLIKDFVNDLGVSRQSVNSALNILIKDGYLTKIGVRPRIYFRYSKNDIVEDKSKSIEDIIKNNFLDIDIKKDKDINNFYKVYPNGIIDRGLSAFISFCVKNHRDYRKTYNEYKDTIKKYNQFRDRKYNDIINADNKLSDIKNKIDGLNINRLYYIDYYSLPVFGRTRLGEQILYSKNSQDRKGIQQIIKEIHPIINNFIKKEKIDCIAFVPATIKRNPQFMTEVENYFLPDLYKNKIDIVSIGRIRFDNVVQQKTLKDIKDRIQNARDTFRINGILPHNLSLQNPSVIQINNSYKKILLIDDAVGSGGTFNEIARKIKNIPFCKEAEIIGISIVGSVNGFEVVNEI